MHAGEAKNGSGQRAHGDKFLHATVETTMPAEKQNKKCTPARRAKAAASVQKEANSSPPPSKRSRRRAVFQIYVGAGRSLSRQPFFPIGKSQTSTKKESVPKVINFATPVRPECQADDRRLGNPHYKKVFRCAAVGLSIPCCLYFTFVSGTSKPSTVRVKVSPSIL